MQLPRSSKLIRRQLPRRLNRKPPNSRQNNRQLCSRQKLTRRKLRRRRKRLRSLKWPPLNLLQALPKQPQRSLSPKRRSRAQTQQRPPPQLMTRERMKGKLKRPLVRRQKTQRQAARKARIRTERRVISDCVGALMIALVEYPAYLNKLEVF